ncbi:MAG: ATP-binding protein [bacterium]|nr:ATP-binding protein [bacterium]
MARTTIRRRLTLLFGTTIVLVVALVGWFVSRQMAREMFIQAQRTGLALTGSIAATASNDFFSYNFMALEQKADEAVRDPDIAYVILYDKEGQVAAFSGQGRPGMGQSVPSLPPFGSGAGGAEVTDHLLWGEPGRGMDIIVPVTMPGSGERWGAVRLGMRLDRIYRQINRTKLAIFVLGLAGTLLGWILAALFTKRITVPLKDLVKATMEVSEGRHDVDLDIHTGDEIEELAVNFKGMAERIREQWQALEANLNQIQELKYFSDLVILSITNGLMILDEQGRIVTFNREAEKILAMDSEEANGRSPDDVWGKESGIARLSQEGLRGHGTGSGRELRMTIHDTERILEITTAPVAEEKGPHMGLLVLFEDLTERKHLEERVRRADRLAAMGTLAAGLAHEIKNPLTAVRAFVQMLPDKYSKDEFRDKFNRIVPKELDRVNGLLEDLLDLVRKPRLRIHTIDAFSAIDHVLGTLEPEAEKRGVTIRYAGRESGLKVLADESYLVRAVHNIVLNAIQAMPGGGVLTIEARQATLPDHTGAVDISVTDTGPGIPSDQVDDIFNPFFTSKEKGTGLGLAVTNKVIEDQGGAVRVVSERATGTTFTISLPAPEGH